MIHDICHIILYHHLAFNAYSLCYFFNYSFTTLIHLTWNLAICNLAIWQSAVIQATRNLAIPGNPVAI